MDCDALKLSKLHCKQILLLLLTLVFLFGYITVMPNKILMLLLLNYNEIAMIDRYLLIIAIETRRISHIWCTDVYCATTRTELRDVYESITHFELFCYTMLLSSHFPVLILI